MRDVYVLSELNKVEINVGAFDLNVKTDDINEIVPEYSDSLK